MATTVTPNWKKLTIILSIIAGILLVIANSGLWVNRYVFNSEAFADVVTDSLTSDSSRSAIASGVVTKAFEGRPITAKLLTNPATNLVEGMLGSNAAESGIRTVAERLNILVTSKEKKVIAFDLTGIKGVIEKITGVAGDAAPDKLDVNAIPDSITLLDTNQLPDFYSYSVAMLWISPLALLGALALLVVPHAKYRKDWSKILAVQGGFIVLAGIFTLAVGPLFKPLVLGGIAQTLPRTVVGNLYDSFIATFNQQSMYPIWFGVLLAAIAGGYYVYIALKPRFEKKIKTTK